MTRTKAWRLSLATILMFGWVFLDGSDISINHQMINDGHAWGYMGETKVKDFSVLAEKRKKSGK